MPKEDRWETFAQENAEYYIACRDCPPGDERAADRFFASGRPIAARLLDDVAGNLAGRDLALEIGCGVGRLLIPMAKHFTRVVGVDVAPTMLEKLSANCRRFGANNVESKLLEEGWDTPETADLIYSWLVFQHVPHLDAISRSMRRLAPALKPGGVAVLQFDTRRPSPAYHVRNALPDAVLPHPWRRGIRRIRRSPRELAGLFDDAGLATVRERGARTAEHVFILRRAWP